jgi:3-deoxy-7-phosphoheptulonate synthase
MNHSMLVFMKSNATEEQLKAVLRSARDEGLDANIMDRPGDRVIEIRDNYTLLNPATFESMPGVERTEQTLRRCKLVSRAAKAETTLVHVRDVVFGGKELVLIAGPCAVESPDQLLQAMHAVKSCGAHMLRGGAYKLRTSPYSFQGLGEPGLKLLAEARERSGLPVITEVVDEESVLLASMYVDMLQIGARNMQNYVLLKQAAHSGKPILLKRGVAATLEEFLNAAEYIYSEGNEQVVLCERGVRGFADYSRNTLDLNVIPAVKEYSHLPIITDPSHGTGSRSMVIPMARASIAAGADGVMVEMHPRPDSALSDGYQSLYPEQLEEMIADISRLAPAVGRIVKRRV